VLRHWPEVSDALGLLFKFHCQGVPAKRKPYKWKGEQSMKAGIFFTGSGHIVILTSYASLTAPNFVEKLAAKGIGKFIVYEAEVEEVKKKYGKQFDLIMKDLHQTDDLRVLDYDGHRVFRNFTLSKLGQPMYHEP
jgi:hypothetical protein